MSSNFKVVPFRKETVDLIRETIAEFRRMYSEMPSDDPGLPLVEEIILSFEKLLERNEVPSESR